MTIKKHSFILLINFLVYSSVSLISAVLICPDGQYRVNDNCISCSVGSFCVMDNVFRCPKNTYNQQTGMSYCHPCPGNTTSNDERNSCHSICSVINETTSVSFDTPIGRVTNTIVQPLISTTKISITPFFSAKRVKMFFVNPIDVGIGTAKYTPQRYATKMLSDEFVIISRDVLGINLQDGVHDIELLYNGVYDCRMSTFQPAVCSIPRSRVFKAVVRLDINCKSPINMITYYSDYGLKTQSCDNFEIVIGKEFIGTYTFNTLLPVCTSCVIDPEYHHLGVIIKIW
jgi:hypothetical protein